MYGYVRIKTNSDTYYERILEIVNPQEDILCNPTELKWDKIITKSYDIFSNEKIIEVVIDELHWHKNIKCKVLLEVIKSKYDHINKCWLLELR